LLAREWQPTEETRFGGRDEEVMELRGMGGGLISEFGFGIADLGLVVLFFSLAVPGEDFPSQMPDGAS
jgi:hypothetical protein